MFNINYVSGKSFQDVRIEKLFPLIADENNTDVVWFTNNNIEDCIRAINELGLEHIHLATHSIDFLADPRLEYIKGITMQFEVNSIEPLFKLKHLTHLGLPENITIEFDFSKFNNLIFLGAPLPKKYINIEQLASLKYIYLSGYRKSNFSEFSSCKKLRRLSMSFSNVENLNGLSNFTDLEFLDLQYCRKLTALDGIGIENANLQNVHFIGCKKIQNADALANLPNLKELIIYQAHELNSLSFLNSLSKLENLVILPKNVGVQNKDYYPLVEALQKINKLDLLKGWKPLKDYLTKKVIIEPIAAVKKSDLELIRDNLDIMNWTEKKENGLEQYTKQNCKKAEKIILDLINQLEKLEQHDTVSKEELIKQSVLKLNTFNASLLGSFIETEEREELSDLFDNIAAAVGLDVQEYPNGIAGKWRDW